MMLQLNDEYLWDYNVESLLVLLLSLSLMSSSRWCCTLLWISCWVHAYSYKVGGSCPVECLNYSNHVDFESLCSTRWFRSWCSTRCFKSHCSTRWKESLCSNTLIGTTCILHSQVVVVSLHCRCRRVVVVDLMLSRNNWTICEVLLLLS